MTEQGYKNFLLSLSKQGKPWKACNTWTAWTQPMLCASYGKSYCDIYAESGLRELARLGVSRHRQSALMNFVNSYWSKPIWQQILATVEKNHKRNKRKTNRGRGTNFVTGLSGKNCSGGNSHPICCTLCSWAHHLEKCAEFLRKNASGAEKVYQTVRFMLWLLQFSVLNTLPSFANVKEPVRFAIRNTQHHSMITIGNQKGWKRKVEMANMRNQKPVKRKWKSQLFTCVLQFAMWKMLVMYLLTWV